MLGIVTFVSLALLAGYLTTLAHAARMLEFRAQIFGLLACAIRRELPLGQTLASGIRERQAPFQDWQDTVLRRILAGLSDGRPLSQALARAGSRAFPARFVAAVAATEGREDLADTLDALARERLSSSQHVGMVVFYLFAIYGMQAFLAIFILPRFLEIFAALEFDLPRGMALFAQWGPLLVAGVLTTVMAVGIYRWWLHRFEWIAQPVQRLAFHLPLAGALLRLQAGARLSHCLGPLIRAQQPLHLALARSAAACGVAPVDSRLQACGRQLQSGTPPAEVLAGLPLPAFFCERMILGLSPGRPEHLAGVVESLGRRCRTVLTQRLQVLGDVFLPALVLVMGGFVLTTYIYVFLPMIQMSTELILW